MEPTAANPQDDATAKPQLLVARSPPKRCGSSPKRLGSRPWGNAGRPNPASLICRLPQPRSSELQNRGSLICRLRSQPTFPEFGVSGVTVDTDEQRMALMRLFYAAAEGSTEKVSLLLQKRVDPNAIDFDQKAALHVAASHGQIEVSKLLLEYRAEPNVIDIMGQTPLMEAEMRNHWGIVQALQDNGAHLMREGLLEASRREGWFISRSELQLDKVISRTLKSSVMIGKFRGTRICAKFAKVSAGDHTLSEELFNELLHEVDVLAQLRHPDLVMFLGANLEEEKILFVTEYMPGGDLDQYYKQKQEEKRGIYRPSLSQLIRWAMGVARALAFLHGAPQPIIHRDLKPLNLLLTDDHKNLKVTDFGISRLITGDIEMTHTMTGGVGTLRYMAPESVRCEAYTEKADIYSFSLILFFMSSGLVPFHDIAENPELVLKQYLKGNEPRPNVSQCHPPLRQIMSSGWAVNALKRPSAFQMLGQLEDFTADVQCVGCKTM